MKKCLKCWKIRARRNLSKLLFTGYAVLASENVQNRSQEHVRDDAGHSTLATTDRCIDSNKRERPATFAVAAKADSIHFAASFQE